ncbi:MAG TPA: HEAT repeat domain-containing protein [Planctomycetota bacterium]
MIATVSLFLAAAIPQEVPHLRGAYRGPYLEVVADQKAAQKEGRIALADGWERWEFWFEHERDALFFGPAEVESSALLPGGGYSRQPGALDRKEVEKRAVPVLMHAAGSSDPEIREAVVLSLGRIGDPRAFAVLEEGMGDADGAVAQAATLGMGMLGNDPALSVLGERFSERHRSGVERGLLAVALGLTGRPEATDLVKNYLERNLEPDRLIGEDEDALLGAIWAAGLLRSRRLVPVLLDGALRLESFAAASSRRARSLILHSLGACGDSLARPYLVEQLFSTDPEIARAAAQGLGRLGDRGALGALALRLEDAGDIDTRIFAMLAVGRLGGPSAQALLEKHAESAGRHRQLQSAWALAVGLAQAGELGGELRDRLVARAGREFKGKSRRDEERLRGAFALGAGFFGDRRAVQELISCLADEGVDPDFAGYVAVALGMLGGDDATATLTTAAREGLQQADFQRGLVTGLALCRDQAATVALVDILLGTKDHQVRWSAAHALGLVRSSDAFARVLAALEDGARSEVRDTPERTAHLILALGRLGDSHKGEALGSLLAGLNYRQEFPLMTSLSAY